MSRSEQRLEELLRGLSAVEADAPPFGRVWQAALERRRARRSRRWLVRAAVALPAAALVLAVLVSAPGLMDPAPESPAGSDELELARSLSSWQAPLDFLLEPPGGDLFGPATPPLPLFTDLLSPPIEEIL